MKGEAESTRFRRALRRSSTDAEKRLWTLLRDRRLAGFKFRRQHPVGRYILDFFCPSAALAIEADGGRHFTDEGRVRDSARTAYLEANRIRVIRFTDREILVEPLGVVDGIWRALHAAERDRLPLTPALSPRCGERG